MQIEIAYTNVIWHSLNAVDRERRTLDIDQVHDHAIAEDLLDWLDGQGLDLGLITGADRTTVHETFASIANATDYSRKFGVEHEGYHLVIAYCVEAIQQLVAP